MRNLLVILLLLSIIAMGIFVYQMYHEKDEIGIVPTPTPGLVPSLIMSPKPTTSQNRNIVVSFPVNNQTVSGSFTISGEARVFENVVSIRITNMTTGKVLTQTTVYASAPDVGQFGPFALRFTIPQGIQSGSKLLVEVYQASPKDGSEIDTARVYVVVK